MLATDADIVCRCQVRYWNYILLHKLRQEPESLCNVRQVLSASSHLLKCT
jgi:hypothetical protein